MLRDRVSSGFTLIEVLIALAIAAVALAGITRLVIQSIDTTTSLRDREIATWVAENRIATLRIDHAWPSLDTTDGDTEMAGRHWHWNQVVISTPYPQLRRVEISVDPEHSKHHAASLVGFLRRPPGTP
jgi:general secretion pathway protein I